MEAEKMRELLEELKKEGIVIDGVISKDDQIYIVRSSIDFREELKDTLISIKKNNFNREDAFMINEMMTLCRKFVDLYQYVILYLNQNEKKSDYS